MFFRTLIGLLGAVGLFATVAVAADGDAEHGGRLFVGQTCEVRVLDGPGRTRVPGWSASRRPQATIFSNSTPA